MKTNFRIRPRCALGAMALALLALCAGCLEKRLVWAPDGSRAAVIGEAGLYLCDGDGRLTELLVPKIYAAAWLGDSRQLVLARERTARTWMEIAPLYGAERPAIEAQAQTLLRRIKEGAKWETVSANLEDKRDIVRICFRDQYAEAVRDKISDDEWKQLAGVTEDVCELVLAHVDGDKVIVDRVRHTGYGKIQDIRPSPRADAIAFTEDVPETKEGGQLNVVLIAGNDGPKTVGRNPAAFPDWSPDGRSIVYVEAGSGSSKDDLALGVLAQRMVFDEQGHLAVAESQKYLAGMVFNSMTHVRCLRDGRILFNAVEVSLPLATQDYGGDQREQLFALDPERQSTLVRLIPRKRELDMSPILAFFEVSPDERKVLFGGMKGEVMLLTLATGEIKTLQEAAEENVHGLPVWRNATEFTYVKRAAIKDGKKVGRPAEIILSRADGEVVLSRSWSDEVLASIAKNHSK
jgi:hypothetical protein